MQDIDYSVQLQLKKNEIITDYELKKITLETSMKIFCKDEFFYRNRMDFPFSFDGPGQRQKGRFDRIVSFEKCYIANSGVDAAFGGVSAWFNAHRAEIDVFDVVKRAGTMRYAKEPAFLAGNFYNFHIQRRVSPDSGAKGTNKAVCRGFGGKKCPAWAGKI